MQLVATLAVVASVLVLAFQTRELTRQSRVANKVAAAKADREIFSMFERVFDGFLQYPEFRPYFYDQTTDTSSAARRCTVRGDG